MIRALLRPLLPVPIRALGWRWNWVRGTEAYRSAPLRTIGKFAWWTLRELRGGIITFTTPSGFRMVAPANSLAGLAAYIAGYHDAEIRQFVLRVLPVNGVFVDLGANIGSHALPAARVVGASGRVIAVEAHPRTFALLARNVAAAGATQIRAINAAVGATAGRVEMQYTGFNPGETHVSRVVTDPQQGVPMVSLDALLAEEGVTRVDYLKVDVEGYELEVLRGATQTLASNPDVVLQLEMVRQHAARYGNKLEELAGLLREAGLLPHHLHADGSPYPIDGVPPGSGGDVIWARSGRFAALP